MTASFERPACHKVHRLEMHIHMPTEERLKNHQVAEICDENSKELVHPREEGGRASVHEDEDEDEEMDEER